jgi:hypothetical protein
MCRHSNATPVKTSRIPPPPAKESHPARQAIPATGRLGPSRSIQNDSIILEHAISKANQATTNAESHFWGLVRGDCVFQRAPGEPKANDFFPGSSSSTPPNSNNLNLIPPPLYTFRHCETGFLARSGLKDSLHLVARTADRKT